MTVKIVYSPFENREGWGSPPEHVHLLLTLGPEMTIERAVQLIKGGSSHALGEIIGRKREVWQHGFTDHRIRDAEDFVHHREYIHQNPVERRIVADSCEYRYCSAFPGFKLNAWLPAAEAGKFFGNENRHEWNSCPSRFASH